MFTVFTDHNLCTLFAPQNFAFCFQFFLDITVVQREIEGNGSAKFRG